MEHLKTGVHTVKSLMHRLLTRIPGWLIGVWAGLSGAFLPIGTLFSGQRFLEHTFFIDLLPLWIDFGRFPPISYNNNFTGIGLGIISSISLLAWHIIRTRKLRTIIIALGVGTAATIVLYFVILWLLI